MAEKQFQIVVLGASGFVGKLVAKHLAQDYVVSSTVCIIFITKVLRGNICELRDENANRSLHTIQAYPSIMCSSQHLRCSSERAFNV